MPTFINEIMNAGFKNRGTLNATSNVLIEIYFIYFYNIANINLPPRRKQTVWLNAAQSIQCIPLF